MLASGERAIELRIKDARAADMVCTRVLSVSLRESVEGVVAVLGVPWESCCSTSCTMDGIWPLLTGPPDKEGPYAIPLSIGYVREVRMIVVRDNLLCFMRSVPVLLLPFDNQGT